MRIIFSRIFFCVFLLLSVRRRHPLQFCLHFCFFSSRSFYMSGKRLFATVSVECVYVHCKSSPGPVGVKNA